MKARFTFILASIVIVLKGFSQSFAPVGAKWVYSEDDGTTGHLIVQEVIKDTIIGGKTVQKLYSYSINKYTPPNPSNTTYYDTTNFQNEFVYKLNDTVFTITNYGDIPIYIFSSEINDTIVISDGSLCTEQFKYYCNQFEYKVIGIDTIQIQGFSFRELEVIPVNNSVWFYDITMYETQSCKIIENIGSEDYFFGRSRQLITLAGPIIKLLCYKDDQINYTSPNYTGDCTFGYLTSIKNIVPKIAFQVFPNPASTYTTFSWKLPLLQNKAVLSISDVTGKIILQYTITTSEGQWIWDTRTISSGVYFYDIKDASGSLSSGKVLVKN